MAPQPFILRSDLDIVGDLEERSCYSYYGEPQLSPKMSDLTFEAVGINHSRNSCGEEISDDRILSIREEGKYVESMWRYHRYRSISAESRMRSAADDQSQSLSGHHRHLCISTGS
jgi:hypothetical protein